MQKLFFTENLVTESSHYRDTSNSKVLFQLVLILRKIEIEVTLRIQFIHVAGTIIITQGNDRFFRGLMNEGVMSG